MSHDGIIHYKPFNAENVAQIGEHLETFLSDYSNTLKDNVEICSFNEDGPSSQEKVCHVDYNDFGPCTLQNKFGYDSSSPCVFLKLNRIFGWRPDFYTKENHPKDLDPVFVREPQQKQIWVDCRRVPEDGTIQEFVFYPSIGFPGFYFPYLNVENYVSPLVAVQVLNVTHGTVVNVECRAWAKNVDTSVRFQISSEGVVPN